MAGSLNKVLLIGRLGNDPEIKQMTNGKSVARLSVATSETWKDKNSGERKEKTEWHRVVIFNEGLVGVVQQYLKKGSQVYIEGQIQTTKYTDNNGQEKYSTQIILQGYNSTLTMLGASNASSKVEDSSMNQDSSSLPSDNNVSSNELDDEVPF
ncbi:MAG: single-stranded DNA-binding protein [Pelagibacteraceae bacterium]|jgi:single-strand DNA-binding protein|nr:single-stranded DNA-binding protein [Pelagibacteraceae bacterium]RZO89214.1 MAG: single-stranded DNA-binding protein [alpha proteobacterium HIMB114]|tara:strand:- start:1481 stop:1939 length:459 start_codon:yes stop_codon:yes gene_type:complete